MFIFRRKTFECLHLLIALKDNVRERKLRKKKKKRKSTKL